MLILVSYDIPNDRRRTKIAKTLRDYGERVQYSVFECNLTKKQLQTMVSELKKLVNTDKDSVRIYPLRADSAAQIQVLGIAKLPADDPDIYIV